MTAKNSNTSKELSITLLVDQTPEEVFNAINNVSEWWGAGIEGNSEKIGNEFIYRHKELHYSVQKIVELIPGKKVVWLITDSSLSFIDKKDEWTNTKVCFDISKKDNKTQIVFTHIGLIPECECFDACAGGWGYYVGESLFQLITTGKGAPDDKSISEHKK